MKFLEKNPVIMIVIGVIGISLSSIFVKYSDAPSSVTASYRLLWTVLILTPFVFGKKASRQEIRSVSKKMVLLSATSGLFLAAHFVLWFESLQYTSVASSTTIVCTEVIWVALGYCFFLKGRLKLSSILSIMVCLIGSTMIAISDSSGSIGLWGDALALLAAVAVAVYTLLGQIARKYLSTTVYTYIVYVACALALLITCVLQGASLFSYGFRPVVVGMLLSLFSTILGHSIFSWCLKYFSPAFVSASKLCEPVVAALIAGALFAEIPSWLQIFGGILVLTGVLYYSYLENRHKCD